MAKPLFQIKKTSWKKLDKILETVQNQINERTPLASETVDIEERPDGMPICLKEDGGTGSGPGDGGGGSGTPASVYGAYNGAPAIFHLLQSSDPTPL